MKIDEIVFGKEYKDKVTGFQGYCTSKHSYINGCHQIGLSSKASDEGKGGEVLSFDVERLEFIGDGVADDFTPDKLTEPGGPGDHDAARSPSRT